MKQVLIIVGLIVVLFVVFNIFSGEDSEQVTNTQERETPSVTVGSVQVNELAGTYTQYDGNLEQYDGKDIVLFFKADWCPSCRVLDSNIKDNVDDIPADVVLLELNYDTETELKKKYAVTTQHTMVQVDTNGNLIKKWSGGNNLEAVLNQLN